MTAAMADIMGTPGLAWHQWRKHGVCSGLSARAYFDLSRRAYDSITRPAVFRQLERPVRLPASLIEEAFLRDNPGLSPDMLTVTCRDGRIQEARLCLSKDLKPVPCGRDAVRDCTLRDALFDPLR
jgi:ribonuclease T2